MSAGDQPPDVSGHLRAAFCVARPDDKTRNIVGIYREIIPVAAPPHSYTTVAFHGGYVGLAADKNGNGGKHINFSIWGEDATEENAADKKFGSIRTRQFTHEGTGWAGRLAYHWKPGVRYHVFVHVKHENGNTIYNAWFGDAEKNEWLLAGRIKKSGTYYLGHAGGFLEHAGKQDMENPRCTGFGPSWVHDGSRWLACTHADIKLKDPNNARAFLRDNVVYLEIGAGIKSDSGERGTFAIKPPSALPPGLPEPVTESL